MRGKGGQMQSHQSIHLRSLTVRRFRPWPDSYPYSVPVIRSLSTLEFQTPVTFLVGENGCGKSTLLETLACAAGSITVGSDSVQADATLSPLRALAEGFPAELVEEDSPRLLHALGGLLRLRQKDGSHP